VRKSLLVAVSLTALAASAQAEPRFSFDTTPGKLPKTVVPSAYRIAITPDLTKLTLAGSETIDLVFTKPGISATLNDAGLTIDRATLEDGSTATVTLDAKAQTATLTFPKTVAAGKHTLTIAYRGPIPDTPSGIYHDDYKTESGQAKRMLVTQFEVADARRMFPGWDEPAFKATFQLSVTLPRDLTAVSNMPPASVTAAGPGLKRVNFATTPRMSTYLLALVAGDMAALDGHAAGTAMHAYAPTGRQDQGEVALKAEENDLPYYNDYFGVKFPLPKLDLLAIPGNYEAGAMENWGAITFIDDDMLFDTKTSAPATREAIYYVVSHEMAHQWSGDLVTLAWWSDTWLNEGFATWMGYKATDHFNPAWDIWPRQHAEHEQAMGQDALPTTHPIQQVVHDEAEANTVFDGISYQKGAAVIRMVEDWLGPDVFRDGMRAYMKAHAYSNATSADLWAVLGAAAHRDVASVAAGFTEQPGVPLVHVARSCAGGDAQVTLTQDRFTIHDPHPKPLTWTIPVTLGAPGTTAQRVLVAGQPVSIKLKGCEAPIKANLGENGYYRTQYDTASLRALGAILPSLAPVDRANLLGDQFALFLADRAPLSDYLNLLPAMRGEQNIAVWTDTLSHLRRLDRSLDGSAAQKPFRAYAIGLIEPEFARLGWDAKPGESFLNALLRPEVIGALGQFGDPSVVAEAGKRFREFQSNPAALPPALRAPVLDIVGHHADQATWALLRSLAKKATSTEEKLRYFSAMAAASDPALIRENADFALTGEIPNGRLLYFIVSMSRESGNPALVFDLVKPIEAKLAAFMVADGSRPTPLAAAAAGSSDPALAQAVLTAPSTAANRGTKIWAARIADGIETAADLRVRAVPVVTAWLQGHQG
jgi:aminopeptidase N